MSWSKSAWLSFEMAAWSVVTLAQLGRAGRRVSLTPVTKPMYVGMCRRIDPRLRGVDGRLIAAGYNKIRPTEWVDKIWGFLNFWDNYVPRPHIVGSYYNPSPKDAFWAWRHFQRTGFRFPCRALKWLNPNGRFAPTKRRRAEAISASVEFGPEPPYGVEFSTRALSALVRLGRTFITLFGHEGVIKSQMEGDDSLLENQVKTWRVLSPNTRGALKRNGAHVPRMTKSQARWLTAYIDAVAPRCEEAIAQNVVSFWEFLRSLPPDDTTDHPRWLADALVVRHCITNGSGVPIARAIGTWHPVVCRGVHTVASSLGIEGDEALRALYERMHKGLQKKGLDYIQTLGWWPRASFCSNFDETIRLVDSQDCWELYPQVSVETLRRKRLLPVGVLEMDVEPLLPCHTDNSVAAEVEIAPPLPEPEEEGFQGLWCRKTKWVERAPFVFDTEDEVEALAAMAQGLDLEVHSTLHYEGGRRLLRRLWHWEGELDKDVYLAVRGLVRRTGLWRRKKVPDCLPALEIDVPPIGATAPYTGLGFQIDLAEEGADLQVEKVEREGDGLVYIELDFARWAKNQPMGVVKREAKWSSEAWGLTLDGLVAKGMVSKRRWDERDKAFETSLLTRHFTNILQEKVICLPVLPGGQLDDIDVDPPGSEDPEDPEDARDSELTKKSPISGQVVYLELLFEKRLGWLTRKECEDRARWYAQKHPHMRADSTRVTGYMKKYTWDYHRLEPVSDSFLVEERWLVVPEPPRAVTLEID